METCYVAKFNVEPDILNMYGESDLVSRVIPSNLGVYFTKVSEKDSIIKFKKDSNFSEIKKSAVFNDMLKIRQELIAEYYKVSDTFQETGEISYSKKYLSTRTSLNKKIEELFVLNPFLRSAEYLKLPSFSRGKTPEIQMGMAYIDRVTKIQQFLDQKSKLNLDTEFYYDTENEQIYIPDKLLDKNNISISFNKIIDEIEKYINSFQETSDFGKISINPIYESFEIKPGKYKEITIVRVYPNGHPSLDRMKALNAATEEVKITAPQGDIINYQEITKEYEEDGEKGYIASIYSRGKNIIENKI